MTELLTAAAKAPGAVREPVSDAGQMSQWRLMRLRFARNKLAMTGVVGLVVMYIVMALAPFLASNDYVTQNSDYLYGPPSPITFINPDGRLGLRPYTYAVGTTLDEKNLKFVFVIDESQKLPVLFFVRGEPYRMLGFINSDIHLFGIEPPQRIYPWGADDLGRDMLARVLTGGQISMTVGLLGVALTITVGSILGGASGYFGGVVDE
ncbi:MAG: peptide/nickel transport system permease protein, partial [Chloroflexota bacterium]|nr:peptide/nickel transport system permease protein [Chloroflexota bacterium]